MMHIVTCCKGVFENYLSLRGLNPRKYRLAGERAHLRGLKKEQCLFVYPTYPHSFASHLESQKYYEMLEEVILKGFRTEDEIPPMVP